MDIINNYKQLGFDITYEAIREFQEKKRPEAQDEIIKQLRSDWMVFISNGLSAVLADKLESNPEEICRRTEYLNKARF